MDASDTKKAPSPGPEGMTGLREQIDAIDDEIIALLLKRIELSNTVMKSKAPSQIVDSHREQMIINRYSEKLSAVSTSFKSKRLVLGIIGTSKLYPES